MSTQKSVQAGITRFGKAEEIAELMSYLISPGAK
jgi:hypothetical protein